MSVNELREIVCATPRFSMPDADLADAVEALYADDASAIIAAYKGGGSSVKVQDGKLGAAPVGRLAWVEGDTALHLALRNQRWNAKRALIADVGADAMIVNSEGETPCFMQLHAASKRLALVGSVAATLLLDFLNIASRVLELESTGMWVIKILLGLVGAASAFDTLLALRWYWKAWSASYISNHPRTKALEKKAEKKAAKEAARLKRAD